MYAQEISAKDEDKSLLDSINKPAKKPLLLAKVKYTAKDCVRINRKENKLILYNEAELYYQDIELRAGIIILDYKTNEVNAGRIKIDSNLVQYPFFKQGGDEINPDSKEEKDAYKLIDEYIPLFYKYRGDLKDETLRLICLQNIEQIIDIIANSI